MYWLYVKHHRFPWEYIHRDAGEKLVLRAFYEHEMEDAMLEQQKLKAELDKAGR